MGGATTSAKPAARAASTSWKRGSSSPTAAANSRTFSRPTAYVTVFTGESPPGRLLPATRALWARRRASVVVELEHGEERLLGYLYATDLLHPPLALLLPLEQLALAGDVAAVALGGHVLAVGLDGLAGDDLRAHGSLDRHVVLLARDPLAQPVDQPAAGLVGLVAVDDHREGVDRVAGQQDVELDHVRRLHPDRLVVERRVAAGARLQLVEEVEHDLGQRQVVGDLHALGGQEVHALVLAAALLA